jgi:hypothetical protein
MKRYVSLILILVVAANTTLPLLGFTLAQKAIRKEMKRFILGKVPTGNLELMQFKLSELGTNVPGLEFINESEFRYKAKMFDIVRKDTTNGLVSYYVVNDRLEEKLIEKFSTFVKDNFGNELSRIKGQLNKLMKLHSCEYFQDISEYKKYMNYILLDRTIYSGDKSYIYPEIPNPPPEIS